MRLSNSDGSPVDPVPFLVVALLGVTVCLSWGPLYLKAHGLAEPVAVAISVTLASATVVAAYYRYVLTANPTAREEVPPGVRIRTLLYAMVVAGLLLLALVALLVV